MKFETSIGGAPAPSADQGSGRRPLLHHVPSWNRLSRLTQKKRKRAVLSAWALAVDLLSICVAFVTASFIRLGALDIDQTARILIILLPIYTGISLNNRAHLITTLLENYKSASRAAGAFLFSAASILLVAFFLKIGADFSRLLFGVGSLFSLALLIVWRNALAHRAKRDLGASPFATLCIYDDIPRGDHSGEGSIVASDFGLSPNPNDPAIVDSLGQLAQGMDSVVVHCSAVRRAQWAFMLKSLDVPTEIVVPELDALRPLAIASRSGQISLVLTSGPLDWNQRLIKRMFDLVVTLAVLPVFLVLLVVVAVAIKIDSPGPIFFKQDRIGLGNRRFKIYKFRSMRVDQCDTQGHQSTSRNDSRITRVGQFLRRTSLDEIPQLLNVLDGSMSLVGPRPHALGSRAEDELFWDIDARYWHRHSVQPGLTGLAQVRGFRGATEMKSDLENRLQSDLEYASNWSLLTDIKILVKTVGVLLHKNAY